MDDQLAQKLFNPCVQELTIRFSLFVNDPPIIIMRFAAFVAFMLPLAALAAPPQPDSADTLNERFGQAITETLSAITATIDQLSASKTHQERAVLHRAQDANKVFQTALLAGFNILNLNGTTPRESEYVDSLCAYTMVKNEITRRLDRKSVV